MDIPEKSRQNFTKQRKMKRSFILTVILLFAIGVFAGEKKKAEGKRELDEKSKLEFDYSFMEGVKCKIIGDFQGAMGWYDNCLKIDPESPVVKYEIASLLLGTEDYNGALHLAREAVAGNPVNLWYRLLLANVLQKKSMIEEACNVYADIIGKYPDKEEFYLIEANLYASVEKWQKAIEVYNRYEKQYGVTEPASMEKIKLYSKLNDVKGASNELLKLINEFPEKNEYLSLLAELYFNYNQDKKGLQILNKLLKEDPQNGYVHLYLADYYRDKKQFSEVAKHMKQALLNDKLDNGFKVQYILKLILDTDTTKVTDADLNSYMDILMNKYNEDLSIRALYSDFLRKDGKLKEALTELEYILEREKNNYMVWEELLLTCNQLEDTNCTYFQSLEAIKYFPEQPLPYVLAGISLMIQKNYAEAVGFFEKGIYLTDDQIQLKSQIFSYLGDCYYNLDSTEQAFIMFDNVLSINPQNVMVLNNYAYYLSLLDRDLSKAEDMSSKAVMIEPGNGTYLDTHAWVLFKRKVYSEALYYMKQAIEKTTDPSGVLYEHYGDILYVNGKKEEALEMWRMAKEKGDEVSTDLDAKIAGTYVFN